MGRIKEKKAGNKGLFFFGSLDVISESAVALSITNTNFRLIFLLN